MELVPSFEDRHYKNEGNQKNQGPGIGKKEKGVSSREFVVCRIFGIRSYGGNLLRLGGLAKWYLVPDRSRFETWSLCERSERRAVGGLPNSW